MSFIDPPCWFSKVTTRCFTWKDNNKCQWAISEFPRPLYQNEVKCSAFDMEMIFHSHANKTLFHKKGCAHGLILKVRVFGTRKWPIHQNGGGHRPKIVVYCAFVIEKKMFFK